MENLATLRDNARISLQGLSCYLTISSPSRMLSFSPDLESMIAEDGRLILTAETREIVHELRSELLKSRLVVSQGQVASTIVFAAQQVADLLRDKLHTMGGDLVEARTRILELEELTTADRNRSESTTLKIRQTGKRCHHCTNRMLMIRKPIKWRNSRDICKIKSTSHYRLRRRLMKWNNSW